VVATVSRRRRRPERQRRRRSPVRAIPSQNIIRVGRIRDGVNVRKIV
jgi:hypothetical protein